MVLLLTTLKIVALTHVQTGVTVGVATTNAHGWGRYRVYQDPIIGGIDEIFELDRG